MATTQRNVRNLTNKAEDIYRQARDQFGDLDRQARGLVNDRPVLAVLSALAFGYVFARASSRL